MVWSSNISLKEKQTTGQICLQAIFFLILRFPSVSFCFFFTFSPSSMIHFGAFLPFAMKFALVFFSYIHCLVHLNF